MFRSIYIYIYIYIYQKFCSLRSQISSIGVTAQVLPLCSPPGFSLRFVCLCVYVCVCLCVCLCVGLCVYALYVLRRMRSVIFQDQVELQVYVEFLGRTHFKNMFNVLITTFRNVCNRFLKFSLNPKIKIHKHTEHT